MKLINIGFGNLVSDIRIVSIVLPESAPVKRLAQDAREKGMLIVATYGRTCYSFRTCSGNYCSKTKR